MGRAAQDLEGRILVLGRKARATVSSLHRIRMRTSRVLAATSAFTALQREVASLLRALRTGSSSAPLVAPSVDGRYVEGELLRLQEELHQLAVRYSPELLSAAESEPPRPATKRSKRWWRFWG